MKVGVSIHGPDVRVPPHPPPPLVASPLTERAIWAAESQRQAPSIAACPALRAWSQRHRPGELVLLPNTEQVLMILVLGGVRDVHDLLYVKRRADFSSRSQMYPNCCIKVRINPPYTPT